MARYGTDDEKESVTQQHHTYLGQGTIFFMFFLEEYEALSCLTGPDNYSTTISLIIEVYSVYYIIDYLKISI